MKKIISLIVILGYFSCIHLSYGMERLLSDLNSQVKDKPQTDRHRQKEAERVSRDLKMKEEKKKEIEAKEHSVNKNKRVKRFSTDKDLPETVKKRNIP